MMDDLISRQDVLDIIMGDGLYCDTYDDKEYSAERIKSIPTADLSEYCDKLWKIAYEHGKKEARPIRCDECKHWDTEWIPATGVGHYCPMIDNVMVGDEWCCYAERKSNG